VRIARTEESLIAPRITRRKAGTLAGFSFCMHERDAHDDAFCIDVLLLMGANSNRRTR
jgi:hypothetical protein